MKSNSDVKVSGWPYCCDCTAYVDPDGIVAGKHRGHLMTSAPPGNGPDSELLRTMQAIAQAAIDRRRQ